MTRNSSTQRIGKGASKEIRGLIKMAEEAGWRIEQTAADKIKFIPPDGSPPVHTAMTPGDKRSWLNSRSRLRRAGLDC
jgi:hypothetical protein